MSKVSHRIVGGEDRWLVRYRDEDNTQRARSFVTEADATEWKVLLDNLGPTAALKLLASGKAGNDLRRGDTVAGAVHEHIEALTGITDGTRSDYRKYLEHGIAKTGLGRLPLSAVDEEAVARWVRGMETKGLAGKTIANRHSLLSAALERAARAQKIARNPAKGVRLPRKDRGIEMRILTRTEQRALVEAMPEYWRPLVVTLMRTGARWGEITALEVGDVHLDTARQTIRIRQAYKHTDTKVMEKGVPKSKAGNRTIAIDEGLADMLRAAIAGKPANADVFRAPRGGVIRQSTFWADVWRPAVDRAGLLPRPRVHDLRHTFATSMLLTKKLGIWELSQHLGHESVVTTTKTYGSFVPEVHENVLAAMWEAMDPLETYGELVHLDARRDRALGADAGSAVIEGTVVA